MERTTTTDPTTPTDTTTTTVTPHRHRGPWLEGWLPGSSYLLSSSLSSSSSSVNTPTGGGPWSTSPAAPPSPPCPTPTTASHHPRPTMDTTRPRLPPTAARVTLHPLTATQPIHPRRLGWCLGQAHMVQRSARLRPRPSIDNYTPCKHRINTLTAIKFIDLLEYIIFLTTHVFSFTNTYVSNFFCG